MNARPARLALFDVVEQLLLDLGCKQSSKHALGVVRNAQNEIAADELIHGPKLRKLADVFVVDGASQRIADLETVNKAKWTGMEASEGGVDSFWY